MDYYYLFLGSLALFISYFTGIIVCFVSKYFDKYTYDHINGPQKVHKSDVPRTGGIAVFLVFLIFTGIDNFYVSLILLICSFPAFLSGILEDLTKKILPLWRLLASFISALLFIFLTDYKIISLGIEFFDIYTNIFFVSSMLTIFASVFLIQACNIIDGLNGLALGTSILILTSIVLISLKIDDNLIFNLSYISLFVIVGAFFWNFPNGKMFLGDGGAYLIGALLSFYIIMLSFRNLEVAPFSLFFLVIYPIYELLRTTIRRTFSNSTKAIEPDTKHLHSMIFKFIFALNKDKLHLWKINAISSIFTLFFPLFGCFIGLLTIFFEDYQIYFPLLVLLYLFITELTFYLIEKELKLNNKL